MTALLLHHLTFELSRRWLARYEARELDAVDLGYSAYRGMGRCLVAVTAGWGKKATTGRRAPG